MGDRDRLDESFRSHDRFVGCEDLEQAEALLRELVKLLARQLALEDHLAEKEVIDQEA
jgi:hypothetical protein